MSSVSPEKASVETAGAAPHASAAKLRVLLACVLIGGVVGLLFWLLQPVVFVPVRGHMKGVNDVVFSPSGEFIATASDDASIRLWTPEGRFVRSITGHSDRVVCLTFSPAGDRLASGAGDGDIRIWDVATGVEISLLHETDESIGALVFDSTGKRLFSVGWHSALDVWDSYSGQLTERIPLPAPAESCAMLADDTKILIGCTDGVVRVCDIATKQIEEALVGHEGGIKGLAIAADGDTVATTALDRTLRLWSLRQRGSLAVLRSNAHMEDVTFCRNDSLVIGGTQHGHVHVIDVQQRVRLLNSETPLDTIKSICCDGKDRCVAGGYKALAVSFSADELLAQ